MVELCEVVGGPVISSFAVQDKRQEAELDPAMIVEDELFAIDTWEPCLVCGLADEGHGVMYCDGCDKPVHVFCAGHDDAPEVWYCEACLEDLENDLELPGIASAVRGRTRRQPGAPRRRGRRNDGLWARIWQEVSQRLDIDLDFPFDEEIGDQRTDEQRREFARWQRRFEVASQQGATNRLRDIANANLQGQEPLNAPAPESQELLRAWNAFDKARESQDAPESLRRRKRKATASPAPSSEMEPVEEQPPPKRPRLRRPQVVTDQQAAQTPISITAPPEDRPTFLSSLLREVETKPISAGSPDASDVHHGQISPRDSSPGGSSSGSATPRALSVSPPPRRPHSPPLCSTILPQSSPVSATFSPFSPAELPARREHTRLPHHRGRRRSGSGRESDDDAQRGRASSSSPSRGLSYSAKEEIQRWVKLSLGPRYRDKEISKEQYTSINKSVSRKLYELVADVSALADQGERQKWQSIADEEVKRAVAALSATATESNE